MWHAIFEKVLGFKDKYAKVKIEYNWEEYIIHQINEAFSDLTSLAYGGNFSDEINRILFYSGDRKGYSLSKKIFKQILQEYINDNLGHNYSIDAFLLVLSDMSKSNKIIDRNYILNVKHRIISKAESILFDNLIPLAKQWISSLSIN